LPLAIDFCKRLSSLLSYCLSLKINPLLALLSYNLAIK